MKKTLKFIFVILFFLTYTRAFSQEINAKNIIPASVYDEVKKNGNVKIIHNTGDNDYTLLPNCEYKTVCENIRVEKNSKNFPFIAEMIYNIPKSDLTKNSKQKEIGIKDISILARSVSKMQGMKYFSSTRKKKTVLYKKAYMIKSIEEPTPIADLVSGSADGLECYSFLEDASFGPCKYKLSYRENENSFYARFTNVDSMGLGFIKAIYPYDLIINMIIVDCGDSFVVYLGADADSVKFPGVKAQLEDSFMSRLDAIFEWFIGQF